MTWAKIDTALHRNPKVRMAGRNARDVYLFVILANADSGADGELNAMILNPEYLADQLQCTVEDAIEGVKRCETFHLLHVTGSIVAICGWDDEWKVKTSTNRVQKHRAQKKQVVEPDETLRNVTSVSCNGETHREIDREIEVNTLSGASGSDTPPHSRPKKVKSPPSEMASKAAEYLRDRVLEKAPNCEASRLTPAKLANWGRELDALEALSPAHSWKAIRESIDWLHASENTFVVQCPSKLRKSWDSIQANRKKPSFGRPGSTTVTDFSDERIL